MDDYSEKNGKVFQGLKSGEPYWVCIDWNQDRAWKYAMIQVWKEKVPFPILIEMAGMDLETWVAGPKDYKITFGYEPEGWVGRNTLVMGENELIPDIMGAIIDSIRTGPGGIGVCSLLNHGTMFQVRTRYGKKSLGGKSIFRTYSVQKGGILSYESWDADEELRNRDERFYPGDYRGTMADVYTEAEMYLAMIYKGKYTTRPL